MKKITLQSATRFPQQIKQRQTSQQCIGLEERGDVLAALRMPDSIMTLPVNHHLEHIDVRDGKELFITSSASSLWLWAWRNVSGNNEIHLLQSKIAVLDSNIKQIVSAGEYLVILTAGSMYYLKYTHLSYSQMQIADAIPQINFTTANETQRTAIMPALTFPSAMTSWHTQLPAENSAAVKNRMRKALAQLEDDAKAHGELLQPQLVRYILTDSAGNVIYASSPTMIGCGIQGNQAITCNATTNSNSYTGIESAQFAVKSFGIKMNCAKGVATQWRKLAANLKVLAAEMRYPFKDTCRITLNSVSIGNYSLTASLETINDESYANYSLASPNWREIASFPISEIASGDTHTIYLTDTDAKITISTDEIGEKALTMLSDYLPDAIASFNGMLLQAGGHTRRMPAWNPVEWLQGTFSASPCTAYLTLQSSSANSGSNMRQTFTFSLPITPSHISPVICVPGTNIDTAILQIISAAGTFSKSYSLRSYATAGYCSFIGQSMAPSSITFAPGDTVITYPDIRPPYQNKSTCIITSEPNNPWSLKHLTDTGITDITGIIPAHNPISSGLFSHLPLYLFSHSGVYACTYEPATNASRMPRRVSAINAAVFPQGVTNSPYATFFIDGKSLLSLESARCKLIVPEFNGESLEYLHGSGSLVALTADGDIDIYNSEMRSRRIPNLKARQIIAGSSGTVIAVSTQNEVVEFSQRNTFRATSITLQSHPIEMDEAIKSAIWDICGTGMNIRLNIYGLAENVTGQQSTLLASYILRGTARVPVFTPIDAPYFSRISIEISGAVTENIAISNIKINPRL
ncbi:MAG: hypothetical protein K2J74_06625 [Muribaculaceae bacterium]|nr:hypothetical protein [Muribaculaceae bacterium]